MVVMVILLVAILNLCISACGKLYLLISAHKNTELLPLLPKPSISVLHLSLCVLHSKVQSYIPNFSVQYLAPFLVCKRRSLFLYSNYRNQNVFQFYVDVVYKDIMQICRNTTIVQKGNIILYKVQCLDLLTIPSPGASQLYLDLFSAEIAISLNNSSNLEKINNTLFSMTTFLDG